MSVMIKPNPPGIKRLREPMGTGAKTFLIIGATVAVFFVYVATVVPVPGADPNPPPQECEITKADRVRTEIANHGVSYTLEEQARNVTSQLLAQRDLCRAMRGWKP